MFNGVEHVEEHLTLGSGDVSVLAICMHGCHGGARRLRRLPCELLPLLLFPEVCN